LTTRLLFCVLSPILQAAIRLLALPAAHLSILELSHSMLSSVPPDLHQLQGLKVLVLSSNRLKELRGAKLHMLPQVRMGQSGVEVCFVVDVEGDAVLQECAGFMTWLVVCVLAVSWLMPKREQMVRGVMVAQTCHIKRCMCTCICSGVTVGAS
jgi:hypothetical protein